MNWREVLLISAAWWIAGGAFLFRPQAAFRTRFAPFGSSGDGLTEDGERAYRRLGIFLILVGTAFAVGLTLWTP